MTIDSTHKQLVKTARMAGIWYLTMAFAGILGFLVYHPKVFVADPAETLANLTDAETTPRIRLLFEFIC